jgi:hypothetical protein
MLPITFFIIQAMIIYTCFELSLHYSRWWYNLRTAVELKDSIFNVSIFAIVLASFGLGLEQTLSASSKLLNPPMLQRILDGMNINPSYWWLMTTARFTELMGALALMLPYFKSKNGTANRFAVCFFLRLLTFTILYISYCFYVGIL